MFDQYEKDWSDKNSQPFMFEGGRHAVLLIHGFTGSPGHMRPLGEAIHAKGYTVQGITLPGHGTHPRDMRSYTSSAYVEAVKQEVISLKEKYQYVTVAGLSMGGVLALIVAEQMEIDGVITFSAPMKTQNKFIALSKWASFVKPTTYWKENKARKSMVDQTYDFGYPGFPTRSAYELHRIILLARKNLFAIQCPLLAIQSHSDETISKDSLDIILKNAGSTKKASLWLDTDPHLITLSKGLGQIITTCILFLNEIGT